MKENRFKFGSSQVSLTSVCPMLLLTKLVTSEISGSSLQTSVGSNGNYYAGGTTLKSNGIPDNSNSMLEQLS